MRANIVGPPEVATRINASMAACHSAAREYLRRRAEIAGLPEKVRTDLTLVRNR
jgi:hypothetical protein